MLLSSLIRAAEEGHASESALSPYVIGAVTLALLLAMLLSLLAFGKGREHS
jgi:hypothetical protein